MSLNTVPTDYHEFEYSKLSVFKLKFMTTLAVFMPNAELPRVDASTSCAPANG